MDHKQLVRDLNKLPSLSDAFYFADQLGADGAYYRIFLYRLASYSDFLLDSAGESRGSMFRFIGDRLLGDAHASNLISNAEDPNNWELVSLPMEKFHNWNENPFTTGLDFSQSEYSMVKEDGSLISSYTGADGKLYLKTKGSLHSDQAKAAMAWLNHPDNLELYNRVVEFEANGWTVNMEWTSPLNRIVVPYQEDKLIVLNVRCRRHGIYADHEYLVSEFGQYAVPLLTIPVHEVAAMAQGEGVVVFFGNLHQPRFVKVKADAYLILHKLKDGVNQPNALFEAVVHETVDDLRASFADDQAVQTMITTMEGLVRGAYHDFIAFVEVAYNTHKDLERKDFAVRMQSLTKEQIPLDAGAAFNVLMNKYLQRDERLIDQFVKSAQGRVVAEYKEQVVKLLGAAPAETE